MKILRIESWSMALDLTRDLRSDWVYRGHADAQWKLEPTLERAAATARLDPSRTSESELRMLSEFQHAAPLALANLPPELEWVDWLSLMQHHGAPSRLLDVTKSFYVAAFFAAADARGAFSIWAVNRRPLYAYAERVVNRALPDEDAESVVAIQRFKEDTVRSCNNAIMNPRPDEHYGVLLIEHLQAHERQFIQRGCFLCALPLETPFEKSLAKTLGVPADYLSTFEPVVSARVEDESILRIDFPAELRLEVLKDLWEMNIHAATLFPGVDGLARSMRHHVDAGAFDPVATRRMFKRVFARFP